MDPEKTKQLKTAAFNMEKVVATMPYHLKLKTAWKGLKQAIDMAIKPEGPKQVDLFNGSQDAD